MALSDVLLGDVSAFWSRHNMLTNLISSLAFALLTITVIDYCSSADVPPAAKW